LRKALSRRRLGRRTHQERRGWTRRIGSGNRTQMGTSEIGQSDEEEEEEEEEEELLARR
jgi:hypothetical protein